jgi:hypothetical protein
MFTLAYLMWVPSAAGAATRQDVAWIGMIVSTYVIVVLQKP